MVRDVALVAILAFAVAGVLSTLLVRRVVLDPTTYTSALAAADAYERIYTEVLPDPEMVELQYALLGRLRLPPATATQARALTTNVLRWAVPPSTIRDAAESVVGGTIAYVRGDIDRLEVDVQLVGLAEHVEDAAITQVRSLLAATPTRAVATIEEYRATLARVVADLEEGVLPEVVPQLEGVVTDGDVTAAIIDALGPELDQQGRALVEAAVAGGIDVDALVLALSTRVVDHVEEVTAAWGTGGTGGPVVDVAERIEAGARSTADGVEGSLGGARRAASAFRPATALLAALAAAVASWGLWRTHRDHPRSAATLVALGLVGGGLATLVAWSIMGRVLAGPLDRAAGAGANDWSLPVAVRSVVADVRAEIGTTLTEAVLWTAGAAVVAGVLLALVAAATPLLLRTSPTDRPVPALVAGAAVAVVVGASIALGGPTAAEEVRLCNGHAELCDRRYDEVVQAATHNSMSSPDVVQMWPEHDGDIRSQLDAGIHTLLIDTHYWTAMTSADRIPEVDPDVPPALAESLFRLVEPFTEEREGTWLCHNHCAFGGIPFLDAMVSVREFLEDNPHDVVTLIIQDAITTEDTEAVMEEAGLGPFLHVHDADRPWATYDELIDSGERLVVFAEQAGPPPPWYVNAFDAMQETPFTVLAPDRFTCEENRGDPAAPLFLLNHWVQRVAPDRADSVVVNAHDVIVERARRCAEERGLMPTFIAVNFYNVGELVRAVDTLNGVGSGSRPAPGSPQG